MAAIALGSPAFKSSSFQRFWGEKASICLVYGRALETDNRKRAATCNASNSSPGGVRSGSRRSRMEDYNTAMKKMMRNPYEYHHDLGMNYTIISDDLVVGSQPQKPDDIYHLKEEGVAYILCLQQDKDIEYWDIDFASIAKSCSNVGVHHMRRPARDFDPNSLRSQLPKAVSSLEWAISDGKGRVYVHCTAGLGRAPAVAIAYMFWFCDVTTGSSGRFTRTGRPAFINPANRRIAEQICSRETERGAATASCVEQVIKVLFWEKLKNERNERRRKKEKGIEAKKKRFARRKILRI